MRKGSHHSNEANEKNRLVHLGKVYTPEQIEHMSQANRRINSSDEVRRKKREACIAFYSGEDGLALRKKWSAERKGNNHALGYRHTEDAKGRMSKNRLGQKHFLGHHQSDVAKAKVRLATRGEANPMYGRTHPLEIRKRLSGICKERWDNWTIEERHNKLVQLGKHNKPTLPECKVMAILNTLYPNEWEWVGNKPTVGNNKPDFRHNNGRNLLILEHGIYWHLWKPQAEHPEWNLTKERVEEVDIAFYKEYGYDTLIIWEDELKHPDLVREKIREFV